MSKACGRRSVAFAVTNELRSASYRSVSVIDRLDVTVDDRRVELVGFGA
jgi:hypothetical protein